MDFDQLRLFVDLVREQSFTRVAEKNFVTQPAVSLSLQKLEEELGVRLLERTTRRVLVTDEGRILDEHARDILARVEEARLALRERREQVMGDLRIATVHSVGLYALPLPLKEYIRRYPEVTPHVDYLPAEQVYRRVQEGEADLGLLAYPEERANLTIVPFLEDDLVVVCSPEHPLAPGRSLRLEALEGQRLVAFQVEIPTRRATDALLAAAGVRVEVRMECDNIEVLKKMVEVGLGVALVPDLAVRQEVRAGTLRRLRIADHAVRRPLALVHRRSRVLSRPQQAFVDLLTLEAAAILAAGDG